MAIKKMALANRWMSVTDVIDRLRQARETREQQSTLLNSLEGRAKQRRNEVERSLADLPPAQRLSLVTKATIGHRGELKRQSLDGRVAHIRTMGKIRDESASARAHYQSAVQMLMRDSLGSERRSRLIHQIEKSGPVELASLAALAASTKDKELGAALLTRNSGVPINERAFSSQELADALVGEDWRRVNQAMAEVERLTMEVVNADRAFETGRPSAGGAIQIALRKRDEAAFGADLSNLDETEDKET